MARWCCSLSGLLACLALCAGCAAGRPGNPFGSSSTKPSNSQLAAKDKESAADVAKSKRKTAGDKSVAKTPAKAKGPGSSIDDVPRTPADSDPKSSGKSAAGNHDPETMAYIDRELRDATPEERAEYLADFKNLPPTTIRQVLRARRMANDQEWASRRGTDPRVGGPVQTAAGESAPAAAERGGGVQNAAGGWDGHAAPGNRAPQTAAAGGRGPQSDGYAPRGTSPVPVGHNAGYRLNNAPGANASQNRAGSASQPPIVTARPNTAGGAQGAGAGQYTQTSGTGSAGAGVRPAVVTIGAPTIAGDAPVEGAAVAEDNSSRAQLAKLISAVEAELHAIQPGETEAQKLEYIRKHVELRRLYLNSGQQERALQAIPGIDPADQEFWQQKFWGETNYFDAVSIPSSAERASQTVNQLQSAVVRLQEKANLELRNVAFCHRISSFGNYEKYPRDEFSPGQEVLLYAEVGNIHSEPIPDGKFRTSLKSTLEIFRHGQPGEPAEKINLPEPETTDICRTHRHDYFHSYQFTIPAKLSTGPHVLKLTIEDQISRRLTTYVLNFMVK